MKTIKQILTVCFFSIGVFCQAQTKLYTYKAPKKALLNDDFSVKVKTVETNWIELDEYNIMVDEVVETKHKTKNASMTYFDFEGEVEVSVTYNKGTLKTARIRPLSYDITPNIKGNTITFKLSQARNLSIEVNGDIFHNLHLFANPIQDYIPKKKDLNVLYFGPGIHDIPNKKLQVPSNTTVYLAGGAVLKGQISLERVSNVKILGRGMVDQSIKGGIHIANSKNVKVEGVFASQCFTGGSENIEITNVKTTSYFGWGDGMNVMSSNNVLFDRVFIRSSDDCTTVYGTRGGFIGGCENITMQNSTLWADVGHPILIGTHGNSKQPEELKNLNYINIDILDHKEMQLDYQGCMSINVGDNNTAKNILFKNIRVEDFREGQLLNLRVFYNKKYCTAPGMGIENISFENINYNGHNANVSLIAGYNQERNIKNIHFKNLIINNVLIHDDMKGKPSWYKTSDMARFFVGEHVENIKFVR